jgi:dienelactone hydrolase
MAQVLLFHHAQGLTQGVRGFAEQLRAAGHVVHLPDLYGGQLFDSLEAGIAHAQALGFAALLERGRLSADALASDLVYAGFSLGVLPAQMLAQTRPGARGALFFHSCVPTQEFGAWPRQLPVQIHAMDEDAIFVREGDLDAARALMAGAEQAELFLYPGHQHLFADASLPSFVRAASESLEQRVLAFLSRIA